MRYLITGGAGFIGSNLAHELVGRGHEVRVVDNFETGRKSNLDAIIDRIDLVEGDLRSKETVETAVENADAILHQAAIPSVPRSIDDPIRTTEVNCLGTANLLSAARDSSVETVVVASSSSVYGPGESLPKREHMPPNPVSPYALSKYWTEQLAVQYSEYYDLDTVALRYFNVFGPRQDPTSDYAAVIPKFIDMMIDGTPPIIYGDGEQSRDFTFVDNVVEANIRAAECAPAGEVLNAACGDRITINELVEHLNDILGTTLEPRYGDPRSGDVRHSMADTAKTEEKIGYDPSVSFRDGLERTVEWFTGKKRSPSK